MMKSLLRILPLLLLLMAMLPSQGHAGHAVQQHAPVVQGRPEMAAPLNEPLISPAPQTVHAKESLAPAVQQAPAVTPKAMPGKPKTPHPRRYMDQKTTAWVTLGLGALLLVFGVATQLIKGTMNAFMAMIAGFGTICIVLGALFLIVGIAMLVASAY